MDTFDLFSDLLIGSFMKILFYSHSSTSYGATSSLLNLISGFRRYFHRVQIKVIVPREGPLIQLLQREWIPFKVIPHYYWTYNFELAHKKRKQNTLHYLLWRHKNRFQKKMLNRYFFYRHLEEARSFDPDIIYVNSSLAPMGAMVAKAMDIPLVWHHRETLNDPVTGFFLEDPDQFQELLKNAALQIFPSRFLKESYWGFPSAPRHLLVFNGVQQPLENRVSLRKPGRELHFGMVGRINAQKGQQEVVQLFNKLKKEFSEEFPPVLHVFGGGDQRIIQKMGEQWKGEQIQFHGFLKREEVFGKMDYLIVNARNESFGRVVAEANASYLPVIARRSGALPEIVQQGKNGILFRDLQELYQILWRLNSNHDEKTYFRLAQDSRKQFEEKFSIEAHSRIIMEELKGVVRQRIRKRTFPVKG